MPMYHDVNNYYDSFCTKVEDVFTEGRDQCSAWGHQLYALSAVKAKNAKDVCIRTATPSINLATHTGQLIQTECTNAALLVYAFVRDNWTKLFALALAWVVIVVGLGILNGYNFSALSVPMGIGMGCGFGLGVLSGVLTVKLWPEKTSKKAVELAAVNSTSSDDDCTSVTGDDAEAIEETPLPIPEEKRSVANLTLLWLDKLGVVTQSFVISVAISIAIAAIPHFPLVMGVCFGGLLGNYLAVKAGYAKPLDFELRQMVKLEERLEKLEDDDVEVQKREKVVLDLSTKCNEMQERLLDEMRNLNERRQSRAANTQSIRGRVVRRRNNALIF